MSPLPLPSRTVTAWASAATLSVVLLVDAGALALVHMSMPDRTREAGYVAAETVDGLPLSQQTALLGYDAARAEAADHAMRITAESFRVLPDGRVKITATRRVPTLIFHHIPRLRDVVEVSATETVTALSYRSSR